MKQTGEYKIEKRPDRVETYFREPLKFKKNMPGCTAVEALGEDTLLVSFKRIDRLEDEQIQFLFRIHEKSAENSFMVTWHSTAPDSIVSHGQHTLTLTAQKDHTLFEFETQMDFTQHGRAVEGNPAIMSKLNALFFDNIVEDMRAEDKSDDDYANSKHASSDDAFDHNSKVKDQRFIFEKTLMNAPLWSWIAIAFLVAIIGVMMTSSSY